MGMGFSYGYTGLHIYGFRAPRGQLGRYEKLFATMAASVRTNPVWLHALIRLIAAVQTNASLQAGNRARIWREAMQQIGEIRMQTWQSSQETLSRNGAAPRARHPL